MELAPAAVTQLNWYWIAVMAIAPLPVGALVAYPIWRLGQPILGNLAGSVVIFGTAIALIFRESIELRRITQACIDAQTTCWPVPPEFTRDVIYASIGLVQVIALFLISLRVEHRLARARYAPEWR
jgi:hypothetical protein